MTTESNSYFEISDTGNFVRVEVISFEFPDSPDWYDNNWLTAKVFIKCGQFAGDYSALFQTVDFERFKQELKQLYTELRGQAKFTCMEGQLELILECNRAGHIEMQITAQDKVADGAELQYTMSFDQTVLKPAIGQLQIITQKFPITGDFNIKNTP